MLFITRCYVDCFHHLTSIIFCIIKSHLQCQVYLYVEKKAILQRKSHLWEMCVYSKLCIFDQELAGTPLVYTPTDSIVKLLLTSVTKPHWMVQIDNLVYISMCYQPTCLKSGIPVYNQQPRTHAKYFKKQVLTTITSINSSTVFTPWSNISVKIQYPSCRTESYCQIKYY